MYTEMLRAVPDSYDDFVIGTNRWMEENEDIRMAIVEKITAEPATGTSDILKILCECAGLGEPLEIVPDEDVYIPAQGGVRATY